LIEPGYNNFDFNQNYINNLMVENISFSNCLAFILYFYFYYSSISFFAFIFSEHVGMGEKKTKNWQKEDIQTPRWVWKQKNKQAGMVQNRSKTKRSGRMTLDS
jgi:hypothetical protein